MPDKPALSIESEGGAKPLGASTWRLGWRVHNQGDVPLLIREAWLPHGRFRAERRAFAPPISLEPGSTALLTFDVACRAAAGEVVENCFVILTMESREQVWRAFTRLTVAFAEGGIPYPKTEVITVDPVGLASDTIAPSATS